MALLPAGRGARSVSRYFVVSLVPLCLFAAVVVDRVGPATLLSTNPELQAAADLERAAKLELQAAGVPMAKSQSLLGAPPNAVFQTIKQHDAAAAAPAPPSLIKMSDAASRDDLNSYFDGYKSPDAPKLAAVNAAVQPVPAAAETVPASKYQLLESRLGEQDAVIDSLKNEVKAFEASLQQKAQEQEQAKAESQEAKQAMADTRAKLAAQQQAAATEAAQQQQAEQVKEQQVLQEQQAVVQQQKAENAASQSSQADLERAIGEAVLGHSSATSATAKLAKLLQPRLSARTSTYGQRVKRNVFGMPVITSQEKARLPGVNVAEWADPRVEREVASSVWQRSHPLNSVEGGSQLASFAVPPPAAAPAAECPLCAFNTDCSINLQARGFHRASGLSDNMPAYHGAITPYGGGGAHMSTLHATVGGIPQDQPLWDKLKLSNKHLRMQQLAMNSAEGGTQLASFAVPPPAAAPEEPQVLCECPRCKLGEEQVGFGDEVHGKQMLEDPDLLETIDDELMRLDPAYALRRVDGAADQTAGISHTEEAFAPHGKANPLSDFNDGPPYSGRVAEYRNQVEPKADTVWKSKTQSLQQVS